MGNTTQKVIVMVTMNRTRVLDLQIYFSICYFAAAGCAPYAQRMTLIPAGHVWNAVFSSISVLHEHGEVC